MRQFRLTALTVKREMAKPDPRIVWDGETPGFGLRVRAGEDGPHGTYLLRYRVRGDRAVRWLTLGPVGGFTADEARTWARGRRDVLKAGGDPAAGPVKERTPDDQIPTLEDYSLRYLTRKESGAAHKRGKTAKASTLKGDRHLLDRLVVLFPKIAAKHLHLITRDDIVMMVTPKDQPTLGNRRLSLLRHLFNVAARDTETFDLTGAVVMGGRWVNPCSTVGKLKERPRQPRPTPDVWPRLFALLDKYGRQPSAEELEERRRRAQAGGEENVGAVPENPVIANLIKLQALTGARGSELREARRTLVTINESIVDGKAIRTGTLTVPDPKEGEAKLIPLSVEAMAVIESLPSIKGCDYIFAGRDGDAPIEQTTVLHWWARHRAEAGMEGFRLHDLRHFIAGVLVKSGASLTQIGALFGHKSPMTTARYAYLDDSAKQALAATAAAAVMSMARPEPRAGK